MGDNIFVFEAQNETENFVWDTYGFQDRIGYIYM